jgi:hypothetical protein
MALISCIQAYYKLSFGKVLELLSCPRNSKLSLFLLIRFSFLVSKTKNQELKTKKLLAKDSSFFCATAIQNSAYYTNFFGAKGQAMHPCPICEWLENQTF